MDNKMAIAVTVFIAILFFVLFLLIPEPHEKKDSSAPLIQGRAYPSTLSSTDLFHMACSQCHNLPPLTHRDREEWRILVLKMNRKMMQTGKQYLSPEQVDPLIDYIVSQQKSF